MSYTDDFYFKKAKKEKVRARSYFKLEEIDEKFNLIKAGMKILDLGACPGSWSEYCFKKTNNNISATGIDIQPFEELDKKNFKQIIADVYEVDPNSLDGPFDGVLSDMAPNTMGIHQVDSAASASLVERAAFIAQNVLKKDGFFIAKYLQGSDKEDIKEYLNSIFTTTKFFKPKASRKNSTEIFFISVGKK